jgi:hypothetical protein
LPKESSRPKPTGGKTNWHWLYKHPVEFSKNNHTRSITPEHSLNFTRSFPLRQFREISVKSTGVPFRAPENLHDDSPCISSGIPPGRPRRASSESRSLARLPGGSVNITGRDPSRQIEPPATPVTAAQAQEPKVNPLSDVRRSPHLHTKSDHPTRLSGGKQTTKGSRRRRETTRRGGREGGLATGGLLRSGSESVRFGALHPES